MQVLLETVETYQNAEEETMTQKYLNMSAALCSAQAVAAAGDRKVAELMSKLAAAQREAGSLKKEYARVV